MTGLRYGGAQTLSFALRDQKFGRCLGDKRCWENHDGNCIQKDRGNFLLGQLRESDLWVFATPIHFNNISSLLQKFLERMLPLISPEIVMKDERPCHPTRLEPGKHSLAIIATCGFPGLENFAGLRATMKQAFAEMAGIPVVAEIFLAMGDLLSYGRSGKYTPFLDSVYLAGAEIAANSALSNKTCGLLANGLGVELERYVSAVNERYKL